MWLFYKKNNNTKLQINDLNYQLMSSNSRMHKIVASKQSQLHAAQHSTAHNRPPLFSACLPTKSLTPHFFQSNSRRVQLLLAQTTYTGLKKKNWSICWYILRPICCLLQQKRSFKKFQLWSARTCCKQHTGYLVRKCSLFSPLHDDIIHF